MIYCCTGKSQTYTTEDIAAFLKKIHLPQYIQAFKEEDITGDVLQTLKPKDLSELNVTNPLHQMKIKYLFLRELQGGTVRYSTEYLSRFLEVKKLEKYIPNLKKNGIDGDMILDVEEDLMVEIMKEVGVKSMIHITRILVQFRTFTTSTSKGVEV